MTEQGKLDLRDPDPITLRFPAIIAKQPIGDIYVASIDAESIQKITFFDVRRRIQDQRDIERYLGIQRPLNQTRVAELNKYVNYADATFPSSIIVSIDDDYAHYDSDRKELVITNTRVGEEKPSAAISSICRVIDGQHRIAGLERFEGENFDLLVSVFVGSDVSDQAYVFATVNLEQTKVNRSLAIDLFDLAKTRSPFKTCHNIAVALDRSEESPFYGKIKRLGVATAGRSARETLTQATFVDGLMPYVSSDPKHDRDILLRGNELPPVGKEELNKTVLRGLFVNGEDRKLGKIYEQYFMAVREKWRDAWDNPALGNILSKTNGYRALASIFGRVYLDAATPGDFVEMKTFMSYFDRVNVTSTYFNTENFKPGTSGESELRRFLLTNMGLK
ncbi:DGQHR domain-containing protein [Rhodobacter capsulatus]|uniref:DGQHR domain-containing protein n=1 Tax=Rhodobacter capsulatus TaxID=1061 RepID=UPI0009C01148|nr:DGQHR domain-containing protein [Rhodobacter capsulatus]